MFFNDLLTYTDSSPVTLTEKGLYLDVDNLDVQKEIIEPSKKHWEALSQNNKKNKTVNVSDNEEETQAEEKIKDNFKENLLAAIAKMSPKKFEAFSRALLNRMGVEFTEKGVQISNDGGIDGYITLMPTISEQQELSFSVRDTTSLPYPSLKSISSWGQ